MKFLVTFALLTILITGNFAASTKYQVKLNPSLTLKEKLAQSHLGSALVNMVSLGNELDVDLQELFDAFDLLKQQLEQKEQDEYDDFDADETAHNTEVQRLQALINQYNGQSLQFQDELTDLQNEGASFQVQLANQQGQLESALAQKLNEENTLQQLNEQFDKETTDHQNAINLLNQALESLNQAKTSSSTVGSFIQTNKRKINAMAQQFEQLKAEKVFTQPLKSFFAQLSTSEPDANTIDRAIEALDNLKTHLQQGYAQLEQIHNDQVDTHTNLLNELQVQIGSLSNLTIPQTQSNIDNNQEAQDIRTTQYTEAQRNLRIETNNLEAENDSWELRVQQHDSLIEQYAQDRQLVEQAEQLLRQQ